MKDILKNAVNKVDKNPYFELRHSTFDTVRKQGAGVCSSTNILSPSKHSEAKITYFKS